MISRLWNLQPEDFIWWQTFWSKLERREVHLPKQTSFPLSHLPTSQRRETKITNTQVLNAFKGLQVLQVHYLSFLLCPIKPFQQRPQECRALLHLCQRTILLDWTPSKIQEHGPNWLDEPTVNHFANRRPKNWIRNFFSVIWCNGFFKTIF